MLIFFVDNSTGMYMSLTLTLTLKYVCPFWPISWPASGMKKKKKLNYVSKKVYQVYVLRNTFSIALYLDGRTDGSGEGKGEWGLTLFEVGHFGDFSECFNYWCLKNHNGCLVTGISLLYISEYIVLICHWYVP